MRGKRLLFFFVTSHTIFWMNVQCKILYHYDHPWGRTSSNARATNSNYLNNLANHNQNSGIRLNLYLGDFHCHPRHIFPSIFIQPFKESSENFLTKNISHIILNAHCLGHRTYMIHSVWERSYIRNCSPELQNFGEEYKSSHFDDLMGAKIPENIKCCTLRTFVCQHLTVLGWEFLWLQ